MNQCINDTDGDGDCSICSYLKTGCLHKDFLESVTIEIKDKEITIRDNNGEWSIFGSINNRKFLWDQALHYYNLYKSEQ